MKIIVGSQNPIKIKAVKNVVRKIWKEAEVLGMKADSRVKEQPTSSEEAIKGAINRAKFCLKETDAEIALGLEAYVCDSEFGMFLSGWVVALDRKGKMGMGNGGSLLLPEKIAQEIKKGKELGPVMDEFIGDHNTKQKQGTVGVLTGNLINRTESFEKSITYSLTKFISPRYYS